MSKKKLLIVVDVQNDFVYGSLGTEEAQKIVPNLIGKVDWYRKNNYPIIFTKDTHYDNYLNTPEGIKLPIKHCVKGTLGHDIIDQLNAPDDSSESNIEKVYEKETFGYHWDFAPWIGFKDEYDVELIGLCTDICVITNALILKTEYPKLNISVDASCCAGTTPENHEAALKVMKSCQIDVIGE